VPVGEDHHALLPAVVQALQLRLDRLDVKGFRVIAG
jgi:hypothetical protein